jgi:hypothetical protein
MSNFTKYKLFVSKKQLYLQANLIGEVRDL